MVPLRRAGAVLALLVAAIVPAATAHAAASQNCTQPIEPSLRRPCSAEELTKILRSDFKGRIVIPRDASWEVRERDIPVKTGVQIVGERGELGSRPTLYTDDKSAGYSLFLVNGTDVRIEGLHLRGPEAGEVSRTLPYVQAITVIQDPTQGTGRKIVIAENELDEWPGAGVAVDDPTVRVWEPKWLYDGPRMTRDDVGAVRVERNYIHNNARDGAGYGVVLGGSSYATIEGNVFNYNRHDVSADGLAYKGYVARFNYSLEGGFIYGDGYYGQHYDVHGTGDGSGKGPWDGGAAGEYFQVAFNTIRGEQDYDEKARAAFELRGRPSTGAEFTDNVVVQDNWGEAIHLKPGDDGSLNPANPRTFNLSMPRNRYDTDYTREIAAGDFDGDKRTDVFVATGTAWYLSRGGVRPWEFLHASTKRTRELAFADVDNDRRTDVLYRDPAGRLGYLKGGSVDLVPLTTLPVPIGDVRFGDFDGDEKTDMFYTRNKQWYVWYGRDRRWTATQISSASISEMLFGEFDDEKGTDVVAVRNDAWSIASGATAVWAKLNRKLTSSFSNAVAADFDGNGRADIAYADGGTWQVSFDGRGGLTTLRKGSNAGSLKAWLIGRFDGGSHNQVVGFDGSGLNFQIWRGLGTPGAFSRLSTQPMR
jgi:hypothetical protein